MTEIKDGRISPAHCVHVMACGNLYDEINGVNFSGEIQVLNEDKERIGRIRNTVGQLFRLGEPIPPAVVNFLTKNGISVRRAILEARGKHSFATPGSIDFNQPTGGIKSGI